MLFSLINVLRLHDPNLPFRSRFYLFSIPGPGSRLYTVPIVSIIEPRLSLNDEDDDVQLSVSIVCDVSLQLGETRVLQHGHTTIREDLLTQIRADKEIVYMILTSQSTLSKFT